MAIFKNESNSLSTRMEGMWKKHKGFGPSGHKKT